MQGRARFPLTRLAPVLLLLSACSAEGDFGRRQPSVITDTFLPVSGRQAAAGRGEPVSSFILTDDEQELRDRAWRFLSPALPRTAFDTYLAVLRTSRVVPAYAQLPGPDAYFAALMSAGWRSSKPPYRRLLDDMAADDRLLDPYFAVLGRVAEADAIRLKGLPFIPDLAPQEKADVVARVEENRGLAWWVNEALSQRIVAYRYALQRLFIEIPDGQGVTAERQLAALDARVRAGAGGRPPGPVASLSGPYGPRRPYHPWPTDEVPDQK
jgi:hypothetical protein